MKALAITIKNSHSSQKAFQNLLESSKKVKNDFDIEPFDACVPEDNDELLKENGIEWSFPWDEPQLNRKVGLWKIPYSTRNPQAKVACALSHFTLWKKCAELDEPILILEHDALFVKKFDPALILSDDSFSIVGINSPVGATRLAKSFERKVSMDHRQIQPVPRIDGPDIPQGLAGGSAYLMKPKGANLAVRLVRHFGLWHNDPILCYQLIGHSLGVTKKWYTVVDTGVPSTTR